MRGLMMDYQLTVPAILRRAETFFPHVEVVSRTAERTIHRYHYRNMSERAKRFAMALKGLGVGAGDRVGTLAWNHHEHLEAYFAVPSIGAVLHPLNLRLSADELSYIVHHAADRVMLVDRTLLPLFEQFRHRVSVPHIVVTGEGDLPAGALSYERLLSEADADAFTYPDLDERDAAAVCYSSGTTGRPKGALYSHRSLALLAMSWTAADTASLSRRDVLLAVVPMFHIVAWGLAFSATLVGAKLVLPGSQMSAGELLGLIASEHVTFSAGVPSVWLSVLHALESGPQSTT